MSAIRIQAKRTTGAGPPAEGLQFGELAYSDTDQGLHVGREDGTVTTFQPGPAVIDWTDITSKPATFPPDSHTHPQYADGSHTHPAPSWTDITSKPATFPPDSHTHPAPSWTEQTLTLAAGWQTYPGQVPKLWVLPGSGMGYLSAILQHPTTAPAQYETILTFDAAHAPPIYSAHYTGWLNPSGGSGGAGIFATEAGELQWYRFFGSDATGVNWLGLNLCWPIIS